jgi:hypothetical protein
MIGVVMDGGRARFWAGLSSTRRSELEGSADWQARLAAALDDPARSWPQSWIAPEQFAAELAARLNHDDEPAVSWWCHLRADDLYLAIACARGVGEAIDRFEPASATRSGAARAASSARAWRRTIWCSCCARSCSPAT